MSSASMMLLLMSLAATAADVSTRQSSGKRPATGADRVVRLFRDVCIAHLGRSSRMSPAVERSGLGFRQTFAGNKTYGPVWTSAHGRIIAYDHSHNHDGDECEINLRGRSAPSAAAAIKWLRRHGLVRGAGEPAEFGATLFRSGARRITVRYDVPSTTTGVRKADAGLTLLIQQPPA